ncbi:unnamed protein product [Trypanosoma congolense IL3000]|uniref:WGS project CAEQ00000000 data, annotated contig 32 n=1 Tax=Trypanosoma congolense (strain IL3000) TaxID=1068625 RepID=F9WEX4_TRYCI|nr:unnamed protein product [Trypanosoma congolense IL3000]
MGESDRTNEERMHQLFKEEVQKWVGQVVEGLGIFAQGDPQAEGERDDNRDDFSKSVPKILNICESMRNLLQPGEEEVETEEQEALVGRTRKCLEEIRRLLGVFSRLAEEEYGNRGEEVSPAEPEIIKEVEARLEKGGEDQAARVLRENWRRLIEASGGDGEGVPTGGHEWESWSRRFEEAEEKLEQARKKEQDAKEEREKVLASLLWRNEQWEQAIKEFGRGEEEQVAQKDVEALQGELDKADKRVTDAQEHRKASETELETARRELENWNLEFERMTQAPGATRTLRAWVLAVSESDMAERELAKARRKQTGCERRLFLTEGSYHLAAATQGVDAAERELEEALEEWNTCEKELKEAEEELRRCCIVADDPPSAQKALERCKEGMEKARLVALEREWKRLEECEKTEQREREPLEKALGAWAKLRLKRAKDEWDRVIQKLKEFTSGGVPARDAVWALKSRVEKCQEELKAAKDMCPTEGPVERVLTLEGLEELVKSELELEDCKEKLERTLHDWNEWRREPWEARRRLGFVVQEWATALPKAEAAGAGWERVRDATHRAARLVEAGNQALSRARRRKEACQAVVKTGEEFGKYQENLNQWRQESARWEAEELRCAEELAQIKSELQPLFSAQEQLQRAKEVLAGANKECEEPREKVRECKDELEEAKKEWEEAKQKADEAKVKLKEAEKKCEEAKEKLEGANKKFEEEDKKWERANKVWEEANEEWKKAHRKVWEAQKECEEASKKFEEVRREWEKAEKARGELGVAKKKWEGAHKECEEASEKCGRRANSYVSVKKRRVRHRKPCRRHQMR